MKNEKKKSSGELSKKSCGCYGTGEVLLYSTLPSNLFSHDFSPKYAIMDSDLRFVCFKF